MKTLQILMVGVVVGILITIGSVVIMFPVNVPISTVVEGEGEVTVHLENNAFNVRVLINGHEIPFVIDTGATDLTISEREAYEIHGLVVYGRQQTKTATDHASGSLARVSQVKIGPLTVRNVQALILPNAQMSGLLGMSVLRHLQWTYKNDTMVLSR